MKHSIFALAGLALFGLASCEKGFDLNSELIPTPGADYKGAKVYIASDFAPFNTDKLSLVQTPSSFRDEKLGTQFYVKLDQPVSEDVVVELAIEANDKDKDIIKGMASSDTKLLPVPAGAIKLSKTSLTIKKGSQKSEDFTELLFGDKEQFRKEEDASFFATIQVLKANQAKVSSNYGKVYVYINREEVFMKPHNAQATLGHLQKLDASTFRLSSGVEPQDGSSPQMAFDGDIATSWDIYSRGETLFTRDPKAYFQVDFAQPISLAGYKVGLSKRTGMVKSSMSSFDLLLSKDNGRTWRKYQTAYVNSTTTADGAWAVPYHVEEVEGTISGVTSLRLLPVDHISYYAPVTQLAELEIYTSK